METNRWNEGRLIQLYDRNTVLDILQNVHSITHEEDQLIWPYCWTGEYTMGQAYKLIQTQERERQGATQNSAEFHWQCLWKHKIPYKVTILFGNLWKSLCQSGKNSLIDLSHFPKRTVPFATGNWRLDDWSLISSVPICQNGSSPLTLRTECMNISRVSH